MPTFTAIALDRLIEPRAAKSMVLVRNSPDPKLERKHSTPNSIEGRAMDDPTLMLERGVSIPQIPNLERELSMPLSTKLDRGVIIPTNGKLDRGVSVPPSTNMERGVSVFPNGKLEKAVSVPPSRKLEKGVVIPTQSKPNNGGPTSTTTATTVVDKMHHWTQISPALYATPESTPLPDSPSSFPPSPYIINHKRRGPRLMKCYSDEDVATWKKEPDEIKVDNGNAADKEVPILPKGDIYVPLEVLDSASDDNTKHSMSGDPEGKHLIGVYTDEHGGSHMKNGPAAQNGVTQSDDFSFQQNDEVDFVDKQDSWSVKSIGENEGTGGPEQSFNSTLPVAEFFDAWEELSSEGGQQQPLPDIESDLLEIRLSLLMEIEKRKLAEETLNNLRSQWQRIREQLSLVGLNLPADPTTLGEGEQPADPAADLCQQVYLARFVAKSIGRAAAKAEIEMEMEAQMNMKNFEITRLLDRLHYFEAMNQEMSQRNQEVVEMARRLRHRRNRAQKWIWGSIATVVTLGSAVLAYSYLRSGKGSSSHSPPEVDHHHPN